MENKELVTYAQQVKQDVICYLEDNYDINELLNDNCGCIDDVYNFLYDTLFNEDSITGNASGSYYFSRYKAEAMVLANIREVVWALLQFDCIKELGHYILHAEWERIDVITRCYELSSALHEAMIELGWMKENE